MQYRKILFLVTLMPILSMGIINNLLAPVDSYVSHSYIQIYSNSDFVAYGFPGNGTAENPYIIENYNITDSSNIAIRIDGSSINVHFVIRGCYLRAQYGIYIQNVASGIAKIENNTIEGSSEAAIYIASTSQVSIINNTIISGKDGIVTYSADYVSIEYNTITANSENGISLDDFSDNFVISENNITLNNYGVRVAGIDGTIENNTIAHNQEHGVLFKGYPRRATIGNNSFIENQGYGICLDIDTAEDIKIINNIMTGDGIYIHPDSEYADFITIANNTVNGKDIGYFTHEANIAISQVYGQLIFINCSNVQILNYAFSDVGNAIFMKECSNVTINNNNITQNSIAGIIIEEASHITFVNNTLSQVGTGLKLTTSTEMNVTLEAQHNTFDNLTVGIDVQKRYSNGNVIDNFAINDNDFHDIENEAIKLVCVQSVAILNNNAENVGKFALVDEKYSFQITNSNINIKSNTIKSVTEGYSFYIIESVGNNSIIDNSVEDSELTFWGYDSSNILYSNNEGGHVTLKYGQNISIENNDILGGVSIEYSDKVKVLNNAISNGAKAINVYRSDNIVVYRNNITNFDTNGIEGSRIYNLSITYNQLNSCPKGIEFYGASGDYLANVTISNNIMTKVIYGIYMGYTANPANITIDNNEITTLDETSATGMYIDTNPGTKLVIRNNSIVTAYRGFYLRDNWDDVTIENNYLKTYSTTGSGIALLIGASSNIKIINNTLISDKCEDSHTIYSLIRLDGTQNAIIYNNKFLAKDFFQQEYEFAMAIDDGSNNQWYNATSKVGNYWMGYNKVDPYPINGSAGTQDLYPIVATDSDSDGLDDIIEQLLTNTSYINADTDNDGMNDGWEMLNGLNPLLDDAGEDPDADNLTNIQEYQNNTNPHDSDTDHDSMPDGWEVQYGLDPLTNDASDDHDGDGLNNIAEYNYGTNPANPDTDGDGYTDNEEIIAGTDPTDPNSHPTPTTTDKGTYLLPIGIIGTIALAVILKKRK